ncbi:hypothetical protein D030_0250, partial [Vibrio parahaemolyticus AQ3810]
DPTRNH